MMPMYNFNADSLSCVGYIRHHATSWKVAESRPDKVIFFSIYLILPTALGPWI
jgi:hypothetical protein